MKIDAIKVCGGIAKKNAMLMQIYADVLKRPLEVVASREGPALGSAVMGAVAAGETRGGYADIPAAARKMASPVERVYQPQKEESDMYDELFGEYLKLHDWFGRGGNDVMRILRGIRRRQS